MATAAVVPGPPFPTSGLDYMLPESGDGVPLVHLVQQEELNLY